MFGSGKRKEKRERYDSDLQKSERGKWARTDQYCSRRQNKEHWESLKTESRYFYWSPGISPMKSENQL